MKKTWLKFFRKNRKYVVCVVVFSIVLPLLIPLQKLVWAVDPDLDGLASDIDNYPNATISTPRILYPTDGENVFNADGDVTFRGSGEIGTSIRVTKEGETLFTTNITGNGISLGAGTSASIDGTQFVSETVIDQFFYDALTEDSIAQTWRADTNASWYIEDSATNRCTDGFTGECERQFPDKTLIVATESGVFIYDAHSKKLWKKIVLSDVSSVFARNGIVYVGMNTGVKILDFISDDFSGSYSIGSTPAIINNGVNSLFGKRISEKDYLVVGTNYGVSIVNLTDESEVGRSTTGEVAAISITAENKLLYSVGAQTFLSTLTIDSLTDDFVVTDLSGKINFGAGVTAVVDQNWIGTSAGLAEIDDSLDGVRNLSNSFATIPMSEDMVAHFTDSVLDRSDQGSDLTNNGSVVISSVATGTDLKAFVFDGSNYLSSASTNFNISGDKISMGMWLKRPTTGGSGSYNRVSMHGTGDMSRNYWISAGDDFLDYGLEIDPYFFGVKTENGQKASSFQTTPVADTWEFVVGTYDGANIKIYKNDTLEHTVAHTGDLTSVLEEFRLGYGFGAGYFTGNIILPFVSAEAFSEAEIAEIYNLTKNWFAENTKISIAGSSSAVIDIACDEKRAECFIATSEGVTKLHTATGITESVVTLSNIATIDKTFLGEWEYTYRFAEDNQYEVLGIAYVGENGSNKTTETIGFGILDPALDWDDDGFTNVTDNYPFEPFAIPVVTYPSEGAPLNTRTIDFTGTGEPNTTIKIKYNEDTVCTTSVDGSGDWGCTKIFDADGTYPLVVHPCFNDVCGRTVDRSFIIDTVAPGDAAGDALNFMINSNQIYATTENVVLGVDIGGDPTHMMISLDGVFDTEVWETYSEMKNIVLPGADGQKNVKGKYRDSAGNISAVFTDNIVLDRTAPTNPTSVIDREGTLDDVWQNSNHDPDFLVSGANDENGIAGYEFYFGTNETAESGSYQTGTGFDPADFGEENDDVRYFRARTRDNAGNYSGWATIFTHKYDHTRPPAPSITLVPTGWTNANNFDFTWTVPEDFSGMDHYLIWTNNGMEETQTTDAELLDFEAEESGVHRFFVKAVDVAENESEDGVIEYRYDYELPQNPTSATDRNGSQNDEWSVVADADFTWSGMADTHSGIKDYDVYWGTNPEGATITTVTTSNGFNPEAITPNTPHYLRVRVRDNTENVSSWTTIFKQKYTRPPSSPTDFSLTADTASGDSPLGTQTNDSTPTFNFTITDPDSTDLIGYQIDIGTNAFYQEIVYTATQSAILAQGVQHFTVDAPLADGEYYFRVKAVDEHGVESSFINANGITGPAFILDTTATSAPVQNSVDEFVAQNSITTSWASVEGAVQYFVELATNESFTQNLTNSGWIANASHSFGNLTNGQKYYLRVKSRDSASNESALSNIVFSTIDISAPTGGTVSADDTEYSSDTTLNFSWQGFTDVISSIDHYHVQISDKVDFSNLVFDDTNFSETTKSFTGINNKEYRARVRAVDVVGNTSAFIESAIVKIDTTAPSAFTLFQNQSPTSSTIQVISWSPATDEESGIVEYELFRQISDAENKIIVPFQSIGVQENNYENTDLLVAHKFTYKVVAKNGSNLTTTSNEMEIVVVDGVLTSSVFENISNFAITNTVPLDWKQATDVADIDGYELFRSDDDVNPLTTTDAVTTEFSDESVKTDGVVYIYKVRAKNATETRGDFSSNLRVLIDKISPTTSSTIAGTIGNADPQWYNTSAQITLTATDSGTTLFNSGTSSGTGFYSGVSKVYVNENETNFVSYDSGKTITLDTEGENTISFYTTDVAGNNETTQNITLNIDTVNPTAQFTATNLNPAENNGFTTLSYIDFRSIGTDGNSGIASVETFVRFDEDGNGFIDGANDFNYGTAISTNNNPATPDRYTFAADKDGEYRFKVRSTDVAGNVYENSETIVKVDRIAPITVDNVPEIVKDEAFTLNLTSSDAAPSSGISATYYTIDGTDPKTSQTRALFDSDNGIAINEDSFFSIKYYSVDRNENEEAVKTSSNRVVLDSNNDIDNDGMSNDFENIVGYGLDPEDPSDASADFDSDGLSNLQEYQNSTNPNSADTDGDTIPDGTEISDSTNPNVYSDHRVIFSTPIIATNAPFTIIGKAPVGKTVTLKKGGESIGTGVVGANGNFFISVDLAVGIHSISAEFQNDETTVITPSFSLTVNSSIENPLFDNLIDQQVIEDNYVVTISGAQDATITLYKIEDGMKTILTSGNTGSDKRVDLLIPTSLTSGEIFVFDQTNQLTSEIIEIFGTVVVSGQITDASLATGISNTTIKFIASDSSEYSTMTDSNGEYSLTVPVLSSYTAKVWNAGYNIFESNVTVQRADITLSPNLTQMVVRNLIQTEDGLQQIASTGESKTIRYAGISRDELLQGPGQGTTLETFEEEYELSVKDVEKRNEGIAGTFRKAEDKYGREIFGGYSSGKMNIKTLKESVKKVARILTGSNLRERGADQEEDIFHSSANAYVMKKPTMKFTVADFIDILNDDIYYFDVVKLNSYGLMHANKNHEFLPNKTIKWTKIFEVILEGDSIVIDGITALKDLKIPEMENVKLTNRYENLVYYTAFKYGLIDIDFNPKKAPKRKQVFEILFRAFPLEINEKKRQNIFSDIKPTDEISPRIFAAQQAGWFRHFSDQYFSGNTQIKRIEFATIFFNAWEAGVETTMASAKDIHGGSYDPRARIGQRSMTQISDAARHLIGREYHKNKEGPYYGPAKAAWNPFDKNTTRAPMQIIDRSENIRRKGKLIIRDIDKAKNAKTGLFKTSAPKDKTKKRIGASIRMKRISFPTIKSVLQGLEYFRPTRKDLEEAKEEKDEVGKAISNKQ